MADILTVTLNPALDVSAFTPHVQPTRKLRCQQVQRHPGGGGVNVARVLHRLGADCAAVCLLGGPTGTLLSQLLAEEGVPCIPVAIAGHTRESFTVLDRGSSEEYRFVLPGPEIHAEELQAFWALLAWQPPPDFVVVSGSLPPGVGVDFYEAMAQVVNAWGARLIVDGGGAALQVALDQGVYLAKPSLSEFRALTGLPLTTLGEVEAAALHFVTDQRAQLLVVSLGESGAFMAHPKGSVYAPALAVEVVSAVGAGDSFVAAMVWALAQGQGPEAAFAYGVAAGSAALTAAGTGLCAAADVLRLRQRVQCLPCPQNLAL